MGILEVQENFNNTNYTTMRDTGPRIQEPTHKEPMLEHPKKEAKTSETEKYAPIYLTA